MGREDSSPDAVDAMSAGTRARMLSDRVHDRANWSLTAKETSGAAKCLSVNRTATVTKIKAGIPKFPSEPIECFRCEV